MNFYRPRLWLLLWVVVGLVGWLFVRPLTALGSATLTVTIGDNFFSPHNLTNTVGDNVKWSWGGIGSHSSTGSGITPLWDSGIHGNGFVFTQTFSVPGNFPFHCVVHSGMSGNITVTAPPTNAPPAISILSPTNGATFAAPWSGTISATASDSNGTVRKVDFFAGSTMLGIVSNPSGDLSLKTTNLAAGSYNLTAVATDDQGATTASARVTIAVVAPAPIWLSLPQWLSSAGCEFSYTTSPGLTYVVKKSVNLKSWTPVATNTADGAAVTFLDNTATAPWNFYSVSLLPNP